MSSTTTKGNDFSNTFKSLAFVFILTCFYGFNKLENQNIDNSSQVQIYSSKSHHELITQSWKLRQLTSPSNSTASVTRQTPENTAQIHQTAPLTTKTTAQTPEPALKLSNTNTEPGTKPPISNNTHTNVLIIARWRSGSSFTAKLFSSRKDAYYVFEPLRVSLSAVPQKPAFHNGLNFEYLKNWYHKNYYEELVGLKTEESERDYQRSVIMQNNYTKHVKTVLEQLYLNCSLSTDTMKNGLRRSGLNYGRENCLTKNVVVSKVIRMKSVTDIPENLLNNGNLKIVYLVRDPRGIANSRFETWSSENKWNIENRSSSMTVLENICKTYDRFLDDRNSENSKKSKKYNQKSLKLDNIHTPASVDFKNNVMVVRYEDIAVKPRDLVKKLFEFTGLKMIINDKRFSENDPIRSFSWLFGSVKIMNNFRTASDSHQTIQNRNPKGKSGYQATGLPFWAVNQIQNSCSRVFEKFGYKKLNEVEYLDLKSKIGKLALDTKTKVKFRQATIDQILDEKFALGEFYRNTMPNTTMRNYGCVDCEW